MGLKSKSLERESSFMGSHLFHMHFLELSHQRVLTFQLLVSTWRGPSAELWMGRPPPGSCIVMSPTWEALVVSWGPGGGWAAQLFAGKRASVPGAERLSAPHSPQELPWPFPEGRKAKNVGVEVSW